MSLNYVYNALGSAITSFPSPNGQILNLSGDMDSTRKQGDTVDASLADFLARPVKIHEILATTVATPNFDDTIDPWTLFLTETSVRKRIEGYKNLQGNLHIRFSMSGNPFYVGVVAATYIPRSLADLTYVSSNFDLTTARLSMYPSLYMSVAIGDTGEIQVPFLNPDNWIDLVGTSYSQMGTLRIRTLQDIRHISGYNSTVQINVFAYMTDVTLASPTVATLGTYVAQTGEYLPDGIISKPASAVAQMADRLSQVPVIGPYAMATSMISSTLGNVARLFGYSRPPVVSDIVRCKVTGLGNLANSDAPEVLNKLALDSKQELTIDPRTVGLGSQDELLVSTICSKECFVCTLLWESTQPDGTALRYMNVTPWMHLVNTTTTPDEIQLTPMCTVAAMFKYWKGTMKYKFRLASSPLHRGILRISYDPHNVGPTTAYNLNYSKIIDISGISEFEFEVGWSASRGWLLADVDCISSVLPNHDNPVFDPQYHNGSICLSVVNPLTSPDTTYNAPVYIHCYVSAGNDIQFAEPTDELLTFCEYYPQSGVVGSDLYNLSEISGSIPGKIPSNSTVYFGESIPSLRTILRRYCYHSAIQPGSNFQGWWKEFNFPYYNGQRTFNRHTTSLAVPYNYSTMSHLNWLTPCYIGWRGGLRSKFVPINNSGLLAVRRVGFGLHSTVSTNGIALSTTSSSFADEMMRIFRPSFAGSGAATIASDGALELEFPFYSSKRFAHGRNLLNSTASNYLSGDNDMHIGFMSQTQSNSRGLLRFVSVAEDFNVFMFVGQPVICYRTPLTSASAVTLPTV